MIDFIKVTYLTYKSDASQAFRNSVQLVIIDGLCLGIDVAGDQQKKDIVDHCNNYLD